MTGRKTTVADAKLWGRTELKPPTRKPPQDRPMGD
jgi:hypothetical protein